MYVFAINSKVRDCTKSLQRVYDKQFGFLDLQNEFHKWSDFEMTLIEDALPSCNLYIASIIYLESGKNTCSQILQ